jgi:hydrogenase/urease accessory protein HupE
MKITIGPDMTSLRSVWVRVRALWLAVPAFMLSCAPGEAHLVTTGLGPVYDGISHFLVSPEDLVPALVMALLAGQCGPEAARRVLLALPISWLVGGLAGFVAAPGAPPELTGLIFILLGVLVAAHLRPPVAAVMLLASVLGLFKGFINGSTMSSTVAGLVSLIGIVATVFIATALVAAAPVAFAWPPAKIAFRVLGSWTTAAGIFGTRPFAAIGLAVRCQPCGRFPKNVRDNSAREFK